MIHRAFISNTTNIDVRELNIIAEQLKPESNVICSYQCSLSSGITFIGTSKKKTFSAVIFELVLKIK